VQLGLVVNQAVVLVDREQGGMAALKEQGIAVSPVLTMQEILGRLYAQGKLDPATYQEVRDYMAEEHGAA